MRHAVVGTWAAALTGTGLALGQPAPSVVPAPPGTTAAVIRTNLPLAQATLPPAPSVVAAPVVQEQPGQAPVLKPSIAPEPTAAPQTPTQSSTPLATPSHAQPPASAGPADAAPVVVPPAAVSPVQVGDHGSYVSRVLAHDPHLGPHFYGGVFVERPYNWVSAEYSLFWFKGDQTGSPLVTSGFVTDPNPGALGSPNTRVVHDGQRLTDNPVSGGRFMWGGFRDELQHWGTEIGYFFLGTQARDSTYTASGLPGERVLARPFLNAITGNEDALLVPPSGGNRGVLQVSTRTRLQGAEFHPIISVTRGPTYRIDAIVGARWLNLDEDLNVRSRYDVPTAFGQFLLDGDDYFGTRNDFFGGDFGAKAYFQWGCWSLDVLGRLAVGGTREELRVEGYSAFQPPGQERFLFPGNLYAATTNGDTYVRHRFAAVPEVGMTLGYQLTKCCRLTAGYNFIYWSDVVRPGGQVDRVVNPRLSPFSPDFAVDAAAEPRRPATDIKATDFWAQGVNFGLQVTY